MNLGMWHRRFDAVKRESSGHFKGEGFAGEFPKIKLYLEPEEVWAHGSTWYAQAHKVWFTQKYGSAA